MDESLNRLMSAADDLRGSIQALAQLAPGGTRNDAMKKAREALKQTQAAMLQLPPELRLDSIPSSPASVAGPKRTSSQLLERNLVDANGKEVADVQDFVIGPDWKVQGAVIEWGGFMGLGDRRAMVPVDHITFDGGADGRAHLDMTREQLEKLPAYQAPAAG
jgi:sporulation protein YlmC with PRC-barrel domain